MCNEETGTADGWDSLWQRFMERVLTRVTERFTEHDLRAKCASDAEILEQARAFFILPTGYLPCLRKRLGS
uniref:Uncharacterized protein n=1 Tax=Candidatus Kentrum sp. FM TaxID=2126340 RepID=A0A450TZ59_9GAMM|nr:MAG: hypothetical protein BECKFM1743A_GA0114220_108172 [Candidatus Kentron sp. FM]VFJ75249.1 MAG: hypothetical protein BECKFM1743C_GA0114222_108312 [Candidatus Kentron sp. FM]VFK21616.1 MAG: hypothetical protein BECKFM1743B_GA0114221_108001 [Candidatus Kentron sp. FM]